MTLIEQRKELVVLLPGLWMPPWVMRPLAWRLGGMGWRCACVGYRSVRGGLDANAEAVAAFVRGRPEARVHLVGHSLGGVVALHATASRQLARVASIVMVGSPARGSYAAARLVSRNWSRPLLGQTVADWLAAARAEAPPGVAVGIVAGTLGAGLGMVFVPDLPRPHDGVVCVGETAVAGCADRVEVPVSHAALLTSKRVARLVGRFLRAGTFAAEPVATAPAGASGLVRSQQERAG